MAFANQLKSGPKFGSTYTGALNCMEILRSNKSGRRRGGDTGEGDTTLKSFGDYALIVGNGCSDRSDGSDAEMDIAFGRSGSEYLYSRRRRFGAPVFASGSIVDVRSFVAGMNRPFAPCRSGSETDRSDQD